MDSIARAVGLSISRAFSRHLTLVRNSLPEVIFASTLLLAPASLVLSMVDSNSFSILGTPFIGSFFTLLAHILMTNLSSAFFLFGGIVTLGLASITGCVLLGLFLGFSMKVAVGTLGLGHVISETWLYTPFELYGFVLAGASGLVVTRYLLIEGEGPRESYCNAQPRSLSLLCHSLVFLVIAAVLEAIAAL